MKTIRNLITLFTIGTFLWKLIRRRKTDRQMTVESPAMVVESRPSNSLANDAAGASVETAQVVGKVSAKAARAGGRSAAGVFGFARSKARRRD
jgi:hypothetical protein